MTFSSSSFIRILKDIVFTYFIYSFVMQNFLLFNIFIYYS